MSSWALIRLSAPAVVASGLAAIAGGALSVTSSFLLCMIRRYGSSQDIVASNSYGFSIVSGQLSGVLIMAGLLGFYARQADKARLFGLVSFLMTCTGTVLANGTSWLAIVVAPFETKLWPIFRCKAVAAVKRIMLESLSNFDDRLTWINPHQVGED